MRISDFKAIFSAAALAIASQQASASIVYEWENPCFTDCDPVGVITVAAETITGFLELDLPGTPVTQTWDASDVKAFSFTFGDFVIDNANSTLENAKIFPFHTTSDNPFSDETGHLVARYSDLSGISLVIAMGGLNLVQPGDPICQTGSCQTQSLGDYTRLSAVPIPAAAPLLAGAVAALLAGLGRRESGAS